MIPEGVATICAHDHQHAAQRIQSQCHKSPLAVGAVVLACDAVRVKQDRFRIRERHSELHTIGPGFVGISFNAYALIICTKCIQIKG